MSDHQWRVRSVDLPHEASVVGKYRSTDLADAFAIRLPSDAVDDPELLARFMFSQPAPWVAGLMHLRDMLVAVFGIKTSRRMSMQDSNRRIGIFKIYSKSAG